MAGLNRRFALAVSELLLVAKSCGALAVGVAAIVLFSSAAWGAGNNPMRGVMPMRSNGLIDTSTAPPGAHLTYYGGRVVSNMQVIEVVWGPGTYLRELDVSVYPNITSFYQQVLNSPWVDWLNEYNTDILANDGNAGTNQTIGRGSFLERVEIAPFFLATRSTTARFRKNWSTRS